MDNKPPPKTDWRFALRHFLLLFIPVWLFLFFIFLIFFQAETAFDRESFETDIANTLTLQKERLLFNLTEIISDLRFMSHLEEISMILDQSQEGIKEHLGEEIKVFLEAKGLYDQFRIIDASGIEVFRVNYNNGNPIIVPQEMLQDKSKRYYFQEILGFPKGNIYVSPFNLNLEHGELELPLKPTIRLGTPIFDRQGQKKGILVMNFSGKRMRDDLSIISSRRPGDFMLVDQEGYLLTGRIQQGQWGFMFENRNEMKLEKIFPQEWEQIRQNAQGQFYTKDGFFSFTTIHPLQMVPTDDRNAAGAGRISKESYQWQLVAHVAPDILADLSRHILNRLFVVCWFMTILLLMGCILLTRDHIYQKRVEGVLKGLPQQIIQAHEEERENISREIHDELGQSLVTLKFLIQGLQPETGQDKPVYEKSYKKIIEYVNSIIEKTRDLAGVLRPPTLDVLGLSKALEAMVGEFGQKKGLRIQCPSCELDDVIFEGEPINFYRIIQEALTNIVKHSNASEASITFEKREDALTMKIQDNGQGFKVDKKHRKASRGLGLSTMAERTRLLKGTFDVESQPGEGTTVTVTLPVKRGKS